VRFDAIPLAEVDDRCLGRWRELASSAAEPNPFFEPEYVFPLARELGQTEAVRLLVASEGDEWLGCLPIHSPRRWHRIPLRGIATWRGYEFYGLLGTPLLCAEHREKAAAALFAGIEELTPAAGFAALEWLAEDGEQPGQVPEMLRARSSPLEFERFERASVRRRAEPDYVEETLSSKRRRELRRQRRKLGEELDAEPELVDRSGDAVAYSDFIALEARAPKAARGTMIASDPGQIRFFTEMCESFARLGRLQLFELQCGGQTVAAKCNLRAGDTVFMLKIAYEEKWASLSPGVLLELEMLKYFHERTDAKFMDSCAAPNNAMINRLWPDRRAIVSYALPARGVTGPAVRASLAAARLLRDQKNARGVKKNDQAA
jgi:CelD/BcsL family acetyltransferase involved in cellulose biosynthesis